MKKIRYSILTLICLVCGAVFFLIQRKWLIVYWTLAPIQSNVNVISKDNSTKRNVHLFFWKNEKFRHNETTIIWNIENKNFTLKQLLDVWFSTLHDEKVFSQKISIENVALSDSEQEAYISLNQNLPWQEWAIIEKWLVIESLLKTIKNADIGLKFINILVNNKPIEDAHLNFKQMWPIEGFK